MVITLKFAHLDFPIKDNTDSKLASGYCSWLDLRNNLLCFILKTVVSENRSLEHIYLDAMVSLENCKSTNQLLIKLNLFIEFLFDYTKRQVEACPRKSQLK